MISKTPSQSTWSIRGAAIDGTNLTLSFGLSVYTYT